ncbi:MAG: hypothetical protein ACLT16_09675 [[Clostridium] innocuum]
MYRTDIQWVAKIYAKVINRNRKQLELMALHNPLFSMLAGGIAVQ